MNRAKPDISSSHSSSSNHPKEAKIVTLEQSKKSYILHFKRLLNKEIATNNLSPNKIKNIMDEYIQKINYAKSKDQCKKIYATLKLNIVETSTQ